jgi:hypothetical protein
MTNLKLLNGSFKSLPMKVYETLARMAANSPSAFEKMRLKELNDRIAAQQGEPTHPLAMLEQAFNQFGESMYSDEFCGQMLAYLQEFSGEEVVLNGGLHGALRAIQQKAKLYGGHIPNPDIMEHFNKYARELRNTYEIKIDGKRTNYRSRDEVLKALPWLQAIFTRYNIK